MKPIPTEAGRALFVGALLACGVGLVLASPAAALVGVTLLVTLAWSHAMARTLGRRVRKQRLEVAWWLAGAHHRGGACTPGAPVHIRGYVRHAATTWLRIQTPTLVGPDELEQTERPADDARWDVPPKRRHGFEFELVPRSVGRWTVQGLAANVEGPLGLSSVPLYFPNPITIRTLPRGAKRARMPRARAVLGDGLRDGPSISRRAGDGLELRELREHQPGDPFHRIAWKPSARRGRLLVRENERDVQRTRVLLLDIGPAMREGAPGERPLDGAVDAVSRETRAALDRGDRMGVITFDTRVVQSVAPGDGRAHFLRVTGALVNAFEVVDEDLTDVDEDGLVDLIAQHVRLQDGIALPPRAEGAPALARRLAQKLPNGHDVHAGNAHERSLRALCRERGLPLPYRRGVERDRTAGLVEALNLIGAPGYAPAHVTVLSTFHGIQVEGPLARSLAHLRRRGHTVDVVSVQRREDQNREGSIDAPEALERILQRDLDAARERGLRALRAAGVSVGRWAA